MPPSKPQGCGAGNINQLVLKADSYAAALERTGGVIAEFVNPKYKDETRTAFKSSTRLECMMQDFPHGLLPGAAVGFTVINQARRCAALSLLVGRDVDCGGTRVVGSHALRARSEAQCSIPVVCCGAPTGVPSLQGVSAS